MRLVHLLGPMLVGAAVVAGCTGGSDAGEPSSGETVRSSVEAPTLDIPSVDEPLDVSDFVNDPCAVLQEFQRDHIGLPVAVGGPASVCQLTAAPEDASSVSIQILPRGLAEHYESWCLDPGKKLSECDTWTTRNINGYPAIQANIESVPEWQCRLLVGVTDDTSISIHDNGIEPAARGSTCDLTDSLAAMTLATIGGAQ